MVSSSLGFVGFVGFLLTKTKALLATHAPFAQSAAILYLVTTSGYERTKQNHVTSRQSLVVLDPSTRAMPAKLNNQSVNRNQSINQSINQNPNTHVFTGKLRLINLRLHIRGRVIAIAVDRHDSRSVRLVRRRVGLCRTRPAVQPAVGLEKWVGASYVYTV